MKRQIYVDNSDGKMFLGYWVVIEIQETPVEAGINGGRITYLALYYAIMKDSHLNAKFEDGEWVVPTEDEVLDNIIEDILDKYNGEGL